jgi:hypothetical protein
MAEDTQSSKSSGEYKSDGDFVRIGVVKKNQDSTNSGMIEVYLVGKGAGADTTHGGGTIKVKYLSPFAGTFSGEGASKGDGKFIGNPHSYGFWATAPDIGTQVICVFPEGKLQDGYYIGCIPPIGQLAMIPAIGASSSVVPNSEEAVSYGGADRLPTIEVNANNPSVAKSGTIYNEAKPVHSFQTAVFTNQGLLRDKVRGPISSSAQRESPSHVFGMSTPGSSVYEGGFTAKTASKAVGGADESKLKAVGRTGGHTFVMDDGDLQGNDVLVRLRTAYGHQIMMNDSEQTLFVIHANGESWIELGKEGTIDIYSKNSFNVRTEGDLNLHADKDVNIHAGKNINMYAGKTLAVESVKDMSFKSGAKFEGYAASNYSFKIGGSMIMSAGGKAGFEAGGTTAIVGSKVNLNSGGSGLTATQVPSITKTSHTDAAYSPKVGWTSPGPKNFDSVTSRAPTHQPWPGAGKGIPK